MGKARTVEELLSKIDSELAWRKREISGITFDIHEVEQSGDSSKIQRYLKYGILSLYSHWEGTIKKISIYYLEHVIIQKRKYNELSINFLTLSILKDIEQASQAKTKTKKIQLIDNLLSKLNDEIDQKIKAEDIIDARSNLSWEVLEEIYSIIGFSLEDNTKKTCIDSKLIHNRNFIAHGERFERVTGIVNYDDFEKLKNDVVDLIDQFRNQVIEAATNQKYLIYPTDN